MPNANKDVTLSLSAKNLAARPFAEVSQAIDLLTKKIAQQSEGSAKGEATTRELTNSLNKLNQAQVALASQNALITSYEKLSEKFADAQAKAAQTAAALAKLRQGQEASGLSVTKYGQALTRAETSNEKAQASLQKLAGTVGIAALKLNELGADLGNLAGTQDELVAANARLDLSYNQVTTAIENYDANLRLTRAAQAEQVTVAKEAAEAQKVLETALRASAKAESELAASIEAAQTKLAAQAAAEQAAAEAQADLEQRAILEQNNAELAAERRVRQLQEQTRAENIERQAAMLAARERLQAEYNLAKETQESIKIKQQEREAQDALNKSIFESIGLTEKQISQLQRGAAVQSGLPKNNQSGSGEPSILGLKPYELQNLSYQVNDVVSSLASGQNFTQVIAQQGGQIFQIFERQIGSLISLLPQLVAAAVVIGSVALAFERLGEKASSLRQFNALLDLNTQGNNYNAKALQENVTEIEQLGHSYEDATEAVKAFVQAGVSQNQIPKLSQFASDLTKLNDTVSLAEATKQVTAAYSGNIDAVRKLADEYHLFSPAQERAIEEAFRFGKGQEVLPGILDQVKGKLHDAADVIQGPFQKALVEAKNGFHDFLDVVANDGAVQGLIHSFTELVGLAKQLGKLGSVKPISPTDDYAGQLKSYIDQQKVAEQLFKARGPGLTGGKDAYDAGIKAYSQAIGKAEDKLVDLRNQQASVADAAEKSANKQVGAIKTVSAADAARSKAYIEQKRLEAAAASPLNPGAQVQLARTNAEQDAASQKDSNGQPLLTPEQIKEAGKIAADEAQARIAQRVGGIEDNLERQLAQLSKQAGGVDDNTAKQIDAVKDKYTVLFDKILDFKQKGGSSVFGQPLSEFEAKVKQDEEAQIRLVTQKSYEQQLNELLAARKEIYDSINERVKSGDITALQGYNAAKAANAELLPQLQKLAKTAVDFAKSVGGAKPSPQLQAFIAKFESVQSAANKPESLQGAGQAENTAVASEALQRVNDLIEARNKLVEEYQALVTKGVISQAEADKQEEIAYKTTAGQLKEAIDRAQELVDAMAALGKTPELALLSAKLKDFASQEKFVSKSTQEMSKAIKEDFVKDFNTALQGITSEIGKVVAGTENLKQALGGAEQALAKFVSSFLTGIAEIILKKQEEIVVQAILDALGAGGGGGASSLLVGAAGPADITPGYSHEGNVIGPGLPSVTRRFSPALFADAPRYHSGGTVGLAPNEQAAILQHGEEVLTANDPRNAMNGNRSKKDSTPALNVRHVLVLDPTLVPQAMQGTKGEQVTMSHIKANLPTLRQLLNVGGRRVG